MAMTTETEIRNFFDIPISHFHDRSVRWLFQDEENVRGLLEIVASELVELIDFNRLTQLNRSFIPNNLREQESDIVLSVPFHSESEMDELFIYILIEHQSTVDPIMEFRVLFYMTQIWDSQRQQWQINNVPKSQWRFRPIIPIVFYTGAQKWNALVPLKELMDLPDALSRFVPKFDSLFLSVKEIGEIDLAKTEHLFGWLLTVLQQEGASKEDISNALIKTLSHLDTFDEEQSQQRERAILYLLLLILHRRPAEERNELITLIDQHTSDVDVETMARSMDKVLIERGEEQGKIQAKQEDVLKLLQYKYNFPSESAFESAANEIKSIRNISQLDSIFNKALSDVPLSEIGLQTTQGFLDEKRG